MFEGTSDQVSRSPMSKGEKRFTVLAILVLVAAMILMAVYSIKLP